VLSASAPADLGANDLKHLIAATKKAVDQRATAVVATFGLSLDPKAGTCVGDIFRYSLSLLGRIDRVPERLPMAYMNLTRHTRV
jgi:nitric oxide reductase NorD protein